jgi:Zn-dependent protease
MPARSALTLFHVRGIRIGVDYSWFLVLFLVIIWMSGYYESITGEGSGPYLLAVISALAFFGSILLHELGHAFVALRNGIGISDITLWLFGGVARMTRDTDSAGVEFRVAIGGPLVSLAIAMTAAAAGIAIAGSEQGFLDAMAVRDGAEVSGPLAVVAWLAMINTLVLAFNLIPAFPLDGGRIARAIAWRLTGDRNRATRFAAGMGQAFAYVFVGVGVLLLLSGDAIDGIWLALIGFLLGSSARGAAARTELTSRIAGIRVADVMDAEPVSIPDDATVERALDEFFLRYRWPWFPVTDPTHRFLGLLVRESADAVPEPARSTQRVGDVFEADASGSLQISTDATLESLLGNDALRRLGGLAAVDAQGTLRGIVTAQQVGRALREALVPSEPAAGPPPSV